MNEKNCIVIQISPIEIGLDNGSATNMRQTIICTNTAQFTDAYMRH